MKTYKINDVTLSETELRKLIKENPELKEEKRGRWKPEAGEKYWCVDQFGDVEYFVWFPDNIHRFLWRSKNCFKTEEEAQKALKRIEAINTVTLAIEEANEGWIPNWSTPDVKYMIMFSYFTNNFIVDKWAVCDLQPILPYMKSKDIACQIIEEYEEKLKIIFGIE